MVSRNLVNKNFLKTFEMSYVLYSFVVDIKQIVTIEEWRVRKKLEIFVLRFEKVATSFIQKLVGQTNQHFWDAPRKINFIS